MKKLLLYLLIIVISVPVMAQGSDKEIRLGIGASPSFSWLSSDYENVENDGLKPGIKFGINIDYRIIDNYYFSTGFFLNTQSGRLRYSDSNIPFMIGDSLYILNDNGEKDVSLSYKLKYLEIPLGMKLKTNEIGYFTYFAKFGVNPLFNLSAIGNANQKSIEDEDINEEVNFFNFGYHFGAGLEYALSGNFILTGGLSYNQGLFDVTSDRDGRENDKSILTNISIDLGIFF